MEHFEYDLVVVGAGSGGYAAARTARDLGARVALVDHGPLGGLCILRGCMPSKTLLASSDRAQDVREAGELGVAGGAPQIDFRAIMQRKARIIKGFTDYRVDQIESFPLHRGEARFLSPTQLAVGAAVVLRADRFIIGTGSVIAPPALHGMVETGYIDSDRALELDAPPKSLIVLGGGYVGSELGQFFARIGIPTTFLIRSGQLLTGEDADVGEALTESFRADGIRIETGVKLLRAERRGELKVVHFEQGGHPRELAAHEIFYALGRVPQIAGLDLERAGVRAHPISGIEVGDDLRTSNPNIFAVGDVLGGHLLVHVAIYQGEIAARNALRNGRERADYSLVTAHTVFTDPQIAIAGKTEKELEAGGIAYRVAKYPFDDHGKAIAIGKTKGFVKMLAAPRDGRILGVAIVGAEASDLIHEAIVAMHFHATVHDFVKIPHLHPTMAEILTYPAEELVEILASEAIAV
ncbi:MAG: dihydrolipoyl dehydrogenase family protein [Vulcanimicrobiaceae bacterium]